MPFTSSLGAFRLGGSLCLPEWSPGRGPSVVHSVCTVIHTVCTLKDLVSWLQLACPPDPTLTTAALQYPATPGAICSHHHLSVQEEHGRLVLLILSPCLWAASYITRLLAMLTPICVVFSFLFPVQQGVDTITDWQPKRACRQELQRQASQIAADAVSHSVGHGVGYPAWCFWALGAVSE